MLQDMRDNRHGSPGYLGENYANADGIVVNDSCHDESDTYRLGCKNEAMDLLKKHFYALWI